MAPLRSAATTLSIGVLALLACSRTANQTNMIGHPCKTDADCPSDLVCADEGNGVRTCENRCVVGTPCEDPSKTCQNGACLPSSVTTDPDSGAPPGTDGGNPSSSSGGFSGQGTTVVDNPTYATGGNFPSFAAGTNWVAYLGKNPDGVGGFYNNVFAHKVDGTGSEINLTNGTQGFNFSVLPAFDGDTAYFAMPNGNSAVDIDSAALPAALQKLTTDGSPYGLQAKVVGGSVFFGTLQRLDGNSLTSIDSTGGVGERPLVDVNGTDAYWIHKNSGFQVYKGNASVGTMTGGSAVTGTIPQSADIQDFAMVGTMAYVLLKVNGAPSIVKLDTTLGNDTFHAVTTPAASQSLFGAGNFIGIANNGPSSSIIKVNLATGAQSTVVSLGDFAQAYLVGTDATNVYWYEIAGNPAKPTATRFLKHSIN